MMNTSKGSDEVDEKDMPYDHDTSAIVSPDAKMISGTELPDVAVVDKEPQSLQPRSYSKKVTILVVILICTIVSAIIGVSVYCGNGHCSSSTSSLNIASTTASTNSSSDSNNNTAVTSNCTNKCLNDASSPSFLYDEKVEIITFYLNQITLTNRTNNISINGDEAEDKALYWMVSKDPILNLCLTNVSSLLTLFNTTGSTVTKSNATLTATASSNSSILPVILATTYAQFRFQQRYSLLTLWFQRDDVYWKNMSGWAKRFDECTWHGITCDEIHLGTALGIQNVVTGIRTTWNSISGTLSPELGLLSFINDFQVYFTPKLTGTIPSSLKTWTNISSFAVAYTQLSGSIPEGIINKWTSLKVFDVQNCSLVGTIPQSVGKYWTQLTLFTVVNNYFSGTIPSAMGQWSLLRLLDVDNNAFTGTIPESIGQWNQILEVDFSSNQFTGTIPSSIKNWTKLEYAFFECNSFVSGTIPNSLCLGAYNPRIYTDEWNTCDCCDHPFALGSCPSSSKDNFTTSAAPARSPIYSEKVAIVTSYLNQITWTNRTNNISIDGDEAEDKALLWMVTKDPILNLFSTNVSSLLTFFNVSTLKTKSNTKSSATASSNSSNLPIISASTYEQYRFQQRYSLLTLWFQQDMVPWKNISGWAKRFNECTWHGITCDMFYLGTTLGLQNVVTNIDLIKNNISGTLSPDLGLLSFVNSCQLGYNPFLSGSIPSSLDKWTNISYFGVFYCQLNGSIPETIATKWTSIQYFSVYNNSLTGTIPQSVGYYWKNLICFDVGVNHLTGTIPMSIGQWALLRGISVSDNIMSGTIPESIGQWSQMIDASFSYNRFTGTIPAAIQNWTKLEYVFFQNNSFASGTVPNSLCSGNRIQGVYTDEWNTCDCCYHPLALSSNPSSSGSKDNFTTSAAPTRSSVSGHDELDNEKVAIVTSYLNQITLTNRTQNISIHGEEAEDRALYWMVTKDPILNLSSLNVSSLLTFFDISTLKTNANATISATGTSSSNSSKLPIIFATTYEQFRFQQRYSLLTLWFQQDLVPWNNMSGWAKRFNECTWHGITCDMIHLGTTLGLQNVVTNIDLIKNNISGTLSSDLGLLSFVNSCQLSYNPFLSGSIPSSLDRWTNISDFEAFHSQLNGSIPESIATNWTSIQYFTVYNNSLTGTIPQSIGHYWTQLTSFDVGANHLTGTIPSSIGQWILIRGISVSENIMSGTIPESIGQWSQMIEAFFSYNRFTGTIPVTVIQNWTKLETVYFQNNSFASGAIPNSLCNGYRIQGIYTDVSNPCYWCCYHP